MTWSGTVMLITLLRKLVRSYTPLEFSVEPGWANPRIYLSTVRPVLEYAVPVWQNIPAYLSEAIERVQKRALNIIYPEAESYAHALQLGKLDRLDDRRVLLCYKYMAKMKSPSHPLHHLLPSPLLDAPNYTLRQKTQKYYLFRNMQVCRTKRVEDFFTFKFFKWFNCYFHCYNCKLLYSR